MNGEEENIEQARGERRKAKKQSRTTKNAAENGKGRGVELRQMRTANQNGKNGEMKET